MEINIKAKGKERKEIEGFFTKNILPLLRDGLRKSFSSDVPFIEKIINGEIDEKSDPTVVIYVRLPDHVVDIAIDPKRDIQMAKSFTQNVDEVEALRHLAELKPNFSIMISPVHFRYIV